MFGQYQDNYSREKGGVFLVYGCGGIRKTFLWKTLSTTIRSECEIILIVASSDIASSLLTGGKTSHSCFIIPLNLLEDSFSSIMLNSDVAELLKKIIDYMRQDTYGLYASI